ncbi:MAG: imidazolonepropionase [Candidatus Thalassarchaeaceae archaeon]|nr:MAG: imidazolonepropionase [Marine Group II euryarchaeote MED-G35]
MRTLLYNCGEVAHLSTGDDEFPLSGERMVDRESLIFPPGMGILIDSGKILEISPMQEIVAEFAPWYPTKSENGGTKVVDVGGMSVVPGFVDSHTHLVWSGDRSNELAMRNSGKSYKEISRIGGGIMKTVNSTRSAPQEQLVESGLRRLDSALKNGTTSMEAKSGYGLDLDSEVKLLEVISTIGRSSPCDVRATWLGAHDFPKEMTRNEYVEHLITDQLPVISELSLAKWVDVFCEEGWFTNEQTEEIVSASKSFGLESRLHVDEFVDSGGLQLASELGSVSADHVACSNDDARISAAESGTVQTFLPGTPYVLGKSLDLPIMKCIKEDWPFSFATDFNPNCPITSLPLIGSLVTHRIGIDPITALAAVTRNPATTMFQDTREVRGVISEGVIADLNILWSPSADSWCQTPGTSPIRHTFKNGEIVNSNNVY